MSLLKLQDGELIEITDESYIIKERFSCPTCGVNADYNVSKLIFYFDKDEYIVETHKYDEVVISQSDIIFFITKNYDKLINITIDDFMAIINYLFNKDNFDIVEFYNYQHKEHELNDYLEDMLAHLDLT